MSHDDLAEVAYMWLSSPWRQSGARKLLDAGLHHREHEDIGADREHHCERLDHLPRDLQSWHYSPLTRSTPTT